MRITMIRGIVQHTIQPLNRSLIFISPIFALLSRIWVAYIFLKSGLGKLDNWQSTVLLFANEYKIPLLSPDYAALLGTGTELILPILLMLGLGGRTMILIFFIYNLIAMVSYPFLWTPDGQTGLYQHISWGLLLGLLMCYGPGKLSLDRLIDLYRNARTTRTNISQM
jgi:putative oxidoreductase